jgi:ABC-type nitrate/sulfonate/bicarbonate transport system substrate-binding protein
MTRRTAVRIPRTISLIAALPLALSPLTACGGGPVQSGTAQRFENVTLASVNNMMHLAEFVAVQRGFFPRNGLNVKLNVLTSGSDLNKALQSGRTLFSGTASTSVPLARSAGIPAKLVVPAMNDATGYRFAGPLAIVGRSDRGIRPKDPRSLIGKRVAAHAGSTNEEYLRRYLKKAGIRRGQVKIVPVGTEDHVVSLKQGDVDAAASWEPYVSQEIRELGDKAVTVSRGEPLIGYIIGVGGLERTIGLRRSTFVKFAAALSEAAQWIRGHPDQAAVLATGYISGLDPADAKAAMAHLSFDPRISACTLLSFEDAAKSYEASGEIDKAMPATEMIDVSIMNDVQRGHPQWFADLPPIPDTCKS